MTKGDAKLVPPVQGGGAPPNGSANVLTTVPMVPVTMSQVAHPGIGGAAAEQTEGASGVVETAWTFPFVV